MKTHAEVKASTPARPRHAMPVPHALEHQEQLRSALRRAGVQPRLEIGAVDDPLEREADAVAERVMRMPQPLEEEPPAPPLNPQATWLQAKTAVGNTQASPQLESSLNSLHHGGTPLDTPTRAFFEPRFGENFSQVRLHTDAQAAQLADALNAKAFTLGNDISFAKGQYSPLSPHGKNLLGHELAHVLQQRGANADAPQAKRVQREENACRWVQYDELAAYKKEHGGYIFLGKVDPSWTPKQARKWCEQRYFHFKNKNVYPRKKGNDWIVPFSILVPPYPWVRVCDGPIDPDTTEALILPAPPAEIIFPEDDEADVIRPEFPKRGPPSETKPTEAPPAEEGPEAAESLGTEESPDVEESPEAEESQGPGEVEKPGAGGGIYDDEQGLCTVSETEKPGNPNVEEEKEGEGGGVEIEEVPPVEEVSEMGTVVANAVGGAVQAVGDAISNMTWSGTAHTVLGVASFWPGLGTLAAGLETVLYISEGNYEGAAIAAAGMLPFGKVLTTTVKAVKIAKSIRTVGKAAELAKDAVKASKAMGNIAKNALGGAAGNAVKTATKAMKEDAAKTLATAVGSYVVTTGASEVASGAVESAGGPEWLQEVAAAGAGLAAGAAVSRITSGAGHGKGPPETTHAPETPTTTPIEKAPVGTTPIEKAPVGTTPIEPISTPETAPAASGVAPHAAPSTGTTPTPAGTTALAPGVAPQVHASPGYGRVQSRINIAKGQTRTTPLRQSGHPVSAGFNHVLAGHFGRKLAPSRSVFSIQPGELKSILQDPKTISSPVTKLPDGQFVRVVDTGIIVGHTALKFGGKETKNIKIFTDIAGNLITTYPWP